MNMPKSLHPPPVPATPAPFFAAVCLRLSYNPAVRKLQAKSICKVLAGNFLLCGALALGQQAPSSGAPKPKFQVNFLNSCRPAQADLEEMGRALVRVREKPAFASDFEISRGLTTLTEAEARAAGASVGSGNTPSTWVRIRREFPESASLRDVQYSLSVEGTSASEVLALHMRDSQELLQVLISDSVTGSAKQVVGTDTPPDRIRIERFGKPSIVLARCGAVDQSAYEPLFLQAGKIFEKYRAAMAIKSVVPAELARLPQHKESKAASGNHSLGYDLHTKDCTR
jgi:hypothetical protein